jgi:mono/diheme cytochrome c family protein
MKRIALLVALSTTAAGTAYGKLPLQTTARGVELDASSFPPQLLPAFQVFRDKCVTCHDQSRIVQVLATGTSNITGGPYTRREMLEHGVGMLRKGYSKFDKREIRQVVDMVEYLLEEAQKP